jgi:hypothetical protein
LTGARKFFASRPRVFGDFTAYGSLGSLLRYARDRLALPRKARRVPLADAARIAGRICRLSHFSKSAAYFGARPNDVLLFYCFHLVRVVPVYGRRMPSAVLQPLSETTVLDLQFSIVNGNVLATELSGNNVYDDLCIDKKSLSDAIEHFKRLGNEPIAA